MSRGNPRREAIEFGVLLGISTTMVVSLGAMIFVSRQSPDGLPKIDLDAPVDFKKAFAEVRQISKGDFSCLYPKGSNDNDRQNK